MTHSIGKKTLSGLCIAVSLLLYPSVPAQAEVRFSLGIHLGIHVPVYPRLVLIPGYPVYYSPQLEMNYFFYDGLYWVFHDDDWYSSDWYNGPWYRVSPMYVPSFVLRIPIRYYRRPPDYFRNWRVEAPPHWNERWGRDWARSRPDWDRWNPRYAPRPAPLPSYQQKYSGPRYPNITEQRQRIRSDNYRYQPREEITREQWRPSSRSEPETRRAQPPATTPQQPRRDQNAQSQPRSDRNTQQQDRNWDRDRERNLAPGVPQQNAPVQRQEQNERRQDTRDTTQQNVNEQRREQMERRQDTRDTTQQRPENTQPQVAPTEPRSVSPTRQSGPQQNAPVQRQEQSERRQDSRNTTQQNVTEQRREQMERRQDTRNTTQQRSDESAPRRKLPVPEQQDKGKN